MSSKKKNLLIAGCFVAILAAAIVLIVWKQAANTAPESSEDTHSAMFQKLENMTHDELVSALENITDEELVDLANSPWNVLSKDYRTFDTFSVPFLDGNPHEMWYESDFWLAGTVSSVEQAREAARDFAKVLARECTVEFIGENDLYYQFRVIEGADDYRYAYRMNFYKDSVLRYSKPTVIDSNRKPHYIFEDAIFQKLDYDTVLTVMDQQNRYGLYRYFEENDREYIYTEYRITGVGGDWGINDTVSLIKSVTRISKETGTLETTKTVIKKDVEVPGTALYRSRFG